MNMSSIPRPTSKVGTRECMGLYESPMAEHRPQDPTTDKRVQEMPIAAEDDT